jgi:hypothetical protein
MKFPLPKSLTLSAVRDKIKRAVPEFVISDYVALKVVVVFVAANRGQGSYDLKANRTPFDLE